MVQLLSALGVALLTLIGPFLHGEVGSRLVRRLKAHAELRTSIPDTSPAAKLLDELILAESRQLRNQDLSRLSRKLNSATVAALVFVAVLGGALIYGLVSASLALAGSLWAYILWLLTAIVALLVIGLAAAGLGQLYESKNEEPDDSPESGYRG